MIRAARADDLPALCVLNREVQALHVAARPERYRDPTDDELRAHVAGLLGTAGVVVLVAVDGDVVVGYAVVRRVDRAPHTYARPRVVAYVDQLGVAAGARRSGHGRALMAAAEDQARTWGVAEVTLDVQTFNEAAVGFYRALGYATLTHKLAKQLGE